MKCAILCNGPTRILYKGRAGYDLVVGCNIPWTDVDFTVILDKKTIQAWVKHPEVAIVPSYFSKIAWTEVEKLGKTSEFKIQEMITDKKFLSSGHSALKICVEKHAKQVDIYGADSYYKTSSDSFTRLYIKEGTPSRRILERWKKEWDLIIATNPKTKINFIR